MLPEILVSRIVERAVGDTDDTVNVAGAGRDAKREVRGDKRRAIAQLTSTPFPQIGPSAVRVTASSHRRIAWYYTRSRSSLS